MNEKQFTAVAQTLVLGMVKVAERLKAAEDTIDANGLKIEVKPADVTVEPAQINLEVPETDLTAVVEAITGLASNNVTDGLDRLSRAVATITDVEQLDLSGLIDSQVEIAGSITGSADKFLEVTERSIEAQTKTGNEMARLADEMAKSANLNQQQFNALHDKMSEIFRAMTARRELTFGADGKPDGMELVLRQ